MNKIKTFEDACKALSIDASKLPDVSILPQQHQDAITAHYKLVIIAEALNEGWKPNWNDRSEYKYYPWFEVKASKNKPSGSGVSYDGCAYWGSYASIGSRLCFKSSELAKYAGKQFKKLYEQYFLFK
jgi:hypothetical protein